MSMSEWRDHEVCCSGGCGTVLEDRAGNQLVEIVERVEHVNPSMPADVAPVIMGLYCVACGRDTSEGA